MKQSIKILSTTLALLTLFSGSASASETGGLNSLRAHDLSVQAPAAAMKKVLESDTVLGRDFVEQPPLIPHGIRNYVTNREGNSCLNCHSWKNASKWGATRISVTHFFNRDGQQLADVAPGRYFCLQCHVTQAVGGALQENQFKPVDALQK